MRKYFDVFIDMTGQKLWRLSLRAVMLSFK